MDYMQVIILHNFHTMDSIEAIVSIEAIEVIVAFREQLVEMHFIDC
jgi:hypothetical protein